MKTEKWFANLLDSLKDDFDFRLENIILDLTEQIAKRMKELKISRKKFAELLNVSPPAVTKILNGSSNFTLKTLLSLADALELDLAVGFKEREPGTFQVIDTQQYGFTFGVTTDLTDTHTYYHCEPSYHFETIDTGVWKQSNTIVASGTSMGFTYSINEPSDLVSTTTEAESDQRAA